MFLKLWTTAMCRLGSKVRLLGITSWDDFHRLFENDWDHSYIYFSEKHVEIAAFRSI